jgi:hypothetical protein
MDVSVLLSTLILGGGIVGGSTGDMGALWLGSGERGRLAAAGVAD